MPYRYGHFYVGFVLLVIMVGFWASYFAPIRTGLPLAFHVHAVTAMAWLGFLIVQSVAIHRRMNALHRQIGLASFALFPLLIVGLTMIINLSANRYASNVSPFIAFAGPSFAVGMAIAIAAYLVLFYQALRHRRNVKLHAGYMLATPLILFESPFSRVVEAHMPWLNVIGSPGPQALFDTILISDSIATLFALALYFRDTRHGAPWLVAAAFMMVQGVVMWVTPGNAAIGNALRVYAAVPQPITLAFAAGAGALACWLGWNAVRPRPRRGAGSAAQAA
jgi:hypothetical protein